MAFFIVMVTSSSNPCAAFMSISCWVAARQSPTTNARTSAVMTPIRGGIDIVKNGVGSAVSFIVCIPAPPSIIDGKNVTPVRYDVNPAKRVDAYAISTVTMRSSCQRESVISIT